MRIAEYTEPVHPVRGDSLTALERQLWRFRIVYVEGGNLMRGLRATPNVAATLNEDILFALANHGTLLLCKFLEVWDAFGSGGKPSARVVSIRRCVQPIVDRIRQWKGLDAFRDSVLAHTYETTDGKIIAPQYIMRTLGVPSYHAETLLLLDLMLFAIMVILCANEEAYLPLRPLFEAPSLGPVTIGIKKGTEIEPALRVVLTAVDQHLQEARIPIHGPVADELAKAAGHVAPRGAT